MAQRDPIKVAQGQLLSQRMKSVGMTQVQLAEACGVTQATISKLLSGDRNPSVELLGKLAQALGVQPAQLIPSGPTGPNAISPVPVPPEHLPEGLEGFLQRHAERLRIDARERWYLVNSRFRVEAWVTQDDSFWTDVLEFWRAELGKKLKPSTKPGA